jgi:hypothetical protein
MKLRPETRKTAALSDERGQEFPAPRPQYFYRPQ